MVDILLFSTGVDSVISYYYLKREKLIHNPIKVYVNLNHRYTEIEERYIRRYYPDTIIIKGFDMKSFEEYDAFIPNRNIILASIVSAYFYNESNIRLYFGGLRDDRVEDNNEKFFNSLSETLSLSLNRNIIVKSAFDFKLSKYEIVEWFRKYYDGYELIEKTFSCYNPNMYKSNPHCYSCRACFRRNVSLQDITRLPFDRDLASQYYSELLKNPDKYDKVRYEKSIEYCKKILGILYEER